MTIIPTDGAPVRDLPQVALPEQPSLVAGSPPEGPTVNQAPTVPESHDIGGQTLHLGTTEVQQLIAPDPNKPLEGPAPGVIVAEPAPAPIVPPPPPLLVESDTSPTPIPEDAPLTPEEAARIEALQDAAQNQEGIINQATSPAEPITPRAMDIVPPRPATVSVETVSVPPGDAPAPEGAVLSIPESPTPVPSAPVAAASLPESPVMPSLNEAAPSQSPQAQSQAEPNAYTEVVAAVSAVSVHHTEPSLEATPLEDEPEETPEAPPIASVKALKETPLKSMGPQLEAVLENEDSNS